MIKNRLICLPATKLCSNNQLLYQSQKPRMNTYFLMGRFRRLLKMDRPGFQFPTEILSIT